ncbi:ATP-, maltotriose- and DNA-dependent transcriptional regulator MalT [Asanoa hainanensis]|uniref:ATP-, maltotriose- and DNA-dependent transcriptional regulator MalT n=1 Tax=Asanoa hainanensis TaxID=560556 RepID=A0A239ITJ4_9ACTN|nr:LuxR family transcriptional regulator [Asanoa hainanensis]SNS96538.1 ATP-, maltotriose- and DNA-dependent transcriptional regulator MalT [Asanoa hainanensis]
MSPWRFVGRAAELNRLISTATDGSGRGLIFSGSAGIGKSRLLREGVSQLPTDRLAVWTASANIATASLPFGGLAQVLPTDQPPGLTAAGLLRWAVEALNQQAAGRPIVLAIDDAHLLDPSSAALVYLMARDEGATVLATLRSGEQFPHPIRALWTDDLVELVEIEPMSVDDTNLLLVQMLEGNVDNASADRLWRLSEGNALLLRELVLAAKQAGEFTKSFGVHRWTGRLELAPSLTDLIDTRIGQLTPGVRTVVELAALGEPIGIDLLIKATDAADVEIAEERQLIRVVESDRRSNVRLSHPLYGEVVRRRCPVTRKRRLEAQLADLVEDVGARRRDDLMRVAVWRLDSGTAQDPMQLLMAGAQAFAGFDVPLATRLARAALDAGGGFGAAELLATMMMFGDQPAEALTVLDSVDEHATSNHLRARWLVVRGLVRNWGLSRESTPDELAVEAKALPDPADQARVRSFEAIMRLHKLETAEALRIARSILDRPAAPVSARGLAQCMIAHLQAAQGEARASERAVASVQADAPLWRTDMPYLQLALELARGTRLAIAGDLAGIDAIVADEFADLADAGDFRLGSGYLAILRAQAARLRGQTSEALRTSLQACAALATSRIYAGLAHAERAQAHALRGEADEARAAMADSDEAHSPIMAILYPWREQARAAVLAVGDDLPGAADVLRELVWRLRGDGFAGHEVLALHDLVRLGRAGEALRWPDDHDPGQTVADRLAELASTLDGDLPGIMSAHAQAAARRSGSDLMIAADFFKAKGLWVYAAEAAAGAAGRFRESRAADATNATRLMGELLSHCDMLRTPALGLSRPALTDRERQIARLAASGVSSRDIASEFFLSTRTVENHLQRVYAKLGVAGRGELGPALRMVPDS